MTAPAYAERLRAAIDLRGGLALCVGIDPHPALLDAWGLPLDGDGAERFGRRVVESLADRVPVFKPQSGLFEPFGSRGVLALERILADLREANALSIMDAKRGDIGSTMDGYARAYLSDESPLRSDALTVSPYLGYESLRPAIDLAAATGRGLHVLCRTSNPEGHEVQLAATGDGSVAQTIVRHAQRDNSSEGRNHVGLVVGGTHADLGIDLTGFSGVVLVPGIGAQGGTLSGVASQFGNTEGIVLPSASREVLAGGPSLAGMQERVEGLR
ncbi:orotidine-5'-phosphate decarboxylase [Aestuariimicrobium sp. T2.26MG-19.2B]|uniref:orotidine-5'-phosphate decarboxylase n=1 Tax=Aestuariimicrobium sp. T2.26MG-19.2B TaxID=3040679 RepID=UPI002477B55F|nr:orotidine-5'-phosphate decarboxylase [Aestuariimicrobium sp. T2.26MG-19.2B]CAI9409917.1 Orotidine 5'-phosphate decarboxylase [Aestuariimicrobium sp. T2.26MG-19.2B]